jgi:hypothetical protein
MLRRLLLLLVALVVYAQYPYITYDTSISLNTCYTDADCTIYLLQNASYGNLGLRCNQATSRCEINTGKAVGPAFGITCPNMSLSYRFWDSSGATGLTNQAYLNDGLIIITLNIAAPVYTGILRVYDVACPPPYTDCPGWADFAQEISVGNVTTAYQQQQYVNSPTTTFYFRLLPSLTSDYMDYGAFGVAYFDKSGCTFLAPALIYLDSIYSPDYYGNVTLTPPVPPSNVLIFPDAVVDVDVYGRVAYLALPPYYYEDPGRSDWRCYYGQIFDMTGHPILTMLDIDVLTYANGSVGGLPFPFIFPYNGTLDSTYSYGALSGFVTLQIGIGYCSKPADIRVVSALTNELGVVEAIWAQSIELDLSSTDPAPPPVLVPGTNEAFNTSRMYTRLNLVQFNTYLLRNGFPDPFGPASNNSVDLSSTPSINVVTNLTHEVISTYSICNSPYAIIEYDYSGLNLPRNAGPASLILVMVNLSTSNLTEVYVGMAPVSGTINSGYFTVTDAGFYCFQFWTNFVDGLGFRVVLRSCFQVGYLAAAATQVTSFYNAGIYNHNTFQYTSYAGYGSFVQSEVYLYTPPYLIVDEGITARVQLFRFSPDPIEEEQIMNYGATYVDMFQDPLGDPLSLLALYTQIYSDANAVLYRRNQGPFNLVQYPVFAYDGAADVQTVMVVVQLQLFYAALLPRYGQDYYIPQNNQYICSTPGTFTIIADMTMKARVNVTQPICQGQLAEVYIWADGGFCLTVTNPYLAALGNASPYAVPCVYFYAFYNVEDPNNAIFLYGGENAYIYAAPANTLLRGIATDIMGDIATTTFTATSLVPPNSTTITFLPPVPVCVGIVNGTQGIQEVTWEFVVTGVVNIVVQNPVGPGNITVYGIYGWEPVNVLAASLYNPNNPGDDLPQNCPLLQNMTEYEVYVLCYGKNSTIDPVCTGCTNLPVAYEGANGQTFTTAHSGWWEAYVWVPSTFYDPEVGRFVYCRYALSAHIQVPQLPYLLVRDLRRIQVNGMQCSGPNCVAIDIYTYVDPNFPAYQSLLQLTPSPPFGSSQGVTTITPPFTNISHVVALGQTYQLALTLDDVFCPVVTSYQVNAEGPVIVLARTTRSQCQTPSGTAVLYAEYNSDVIPTGTAAQVCIFWEQYTTQFFSFTLPVNQPEPTALPFSPDFFVSENVTVFYGVTQGPQTVVIYDRCQGAVNCNPAIQCSDGNLILQNPLRINPLLEYQIFQFTVEQFSQPGGGIVISLDNAYYAPCYGNTYNFSFSVFDDLGENNAVYGPYVWYWIEPFTNRILQQSPTCADKGQPILPGPPEVNFKVNVFNITVQIPTGTQYGFRQDGNYTLWVQNCETVCIQTFPVYIQMVNPFDIVLSAGPAKCYGLPGSIATSVSGGTPFLPGQLYDQTYYPAYGDGYLADDNVVVEALYIYYWCTPLNPVQCTRTRLSTQVLPGNYSLIVQDANNCTSPRVNVTVPSPPPIVVSLTGVAVPCATSTYATYEFLVEPNSGNGPPYRVEQDLGNTSVGQNISFVFNSALNQTVCFDVLDRLGCRTTQQICELTPSPEPVSVQLAVYPSCPNQATGRAVATSNNTGGTLTCEWSSNGAVFSSASCTQTGLLPGISLSVTMTTLNGCFGQAFGYIGVRPAIVIREIFRSAIGVLGGPCIDYANFSIGGGVGGPNYTVFLIGDTTGANLTYNRNYTALVTRMCRGVQYIIAASDSDGLCVQTYYSLDPDYTFNGNGTVTQFPIGLPPFSFSSGTDGTVALVIVLDAAEEPKEIERPGFWQQRWPLIVFATAVVLGIIIMIAMTPVSSNRRRSL